MNDLPLTTEPRIVEGVLDLQYHWTPGFEIGRFLKDVQRGTLHLMGGHFYPHAGGKVQAIEREGFVFQGGSLVYDGWPERHGIQDVDGQRSFLALIAYGNEKPFVHRVCGSAAELDSLQPGMPLRFAGRCFLPGGHVPLQTEEDEQDESANRGLSSLDEKQRSFLSDASASRRVVVVTPLPLAVLSSVKKDLHIQGEHFSVHSLVLEVGAVLAEGPVFLVAPSYLYQAAARSNQPWKAEQALFACYGDPMPAAVKAEFERRYGALHDLMPSGSCDPLTEQLYSHPAVLEAVVVEGRKKRAHVVLQQNAREDDRQMREFFRRKGVAVDDVHVVDDLPRTEDGRVNKEALLNEEQKMREAVSVVEGSLSIAYRWHCGAALSRFYDGLQYEGRFYGTKCSSCGGVQVPPKLYCGRCFATAFDFVALPDTGVVESYTTVHLAFPGQPAKPPYTYGYIKLDGANTHFYHLLEEGISVGDRVKAVWKPAEQRKGAMADIVYFKAEG